ncbi:MAG: glycosyltransferase [Acidobacteriota bacterium]|nr:glycosyltransferase [Acidobacteriota bacterium]
MIDDSTVVESRTPHRICVVVPCYNEAQRIQTAKFVEFLKANTGVTLLFVDDGSLDNTSEIIGGIARSFPEMACVLRSDRNRGKAEAVRLGVLHALDHFSPEILGFWDADLATPLESIGRFLNVFEDRPDIEMIFGSRVQLLGRHVQRKAIRHYLGRIFATAVSVVLQLKIYDSQCGAKLFRVQPLTKRIFAAPFLSRWVFDVEILARYLQHFRQEKRDLANVIYEYPLERWVDVAGSKVQASDFFVAFWEVLRIRGKYLT